MRNLLIYSFDYNLFIGAALFTFNLVEYRLVNDFLRKLGQKSPLDELKKRSGVEKTKIYEGGFVLKNLFYFWVSKSQAIINNLLFYPPPYIVFRVY